ncbi:MAG: tetratricopeptide repeat protein, partial [Pyrinomonadaceae bacterium]|nr:tetratricopeptide repeat protein [Pyrinomonadaceae bacterium]
MEARFCRSCGASLRNTGAEENSASPLASTIPLTDQGRATENINAAAPQGRAPETAKVQTGELDNLLSAERSNDGQSKVQPTQEAFDPPFDSEATLVRESPAVPATSALSTPDHRMGVPVNYAQTIPSFGAQDGSATTSLHQLEQQATATAQPNAVVQQKKAENRGGRWWQWAIVGASLIVAAAAIFLVARSLSSSASSNSNAPQVDVGERPLTISERLTEAERLLAAGDVESAIKALREAVALDPANAEARRLLGDALLQNGKRTEAIEEYRQAALNDPQNKAVWAKLASAQFAEGLYAEAAES